MQTLWIWLTACLALAREGPPPDKDDPHVLDLPSSLIDDTAREKILKTCSDPLVQTIDQDPVAVWEGLGCHELHGALDYDWYMNQSRTKFSYVEYISDKMHGPANWRCHHIDNGPCNNPNVQCHQTEFACGHMILNSLANVHAMYRRGYDALLSAHDRVQDDVLSFTDVFAPELKQIDWLGDLLIPLITLGLGAIGEIAEKTLKVVMENVKQINKAKKAGGKGKDPDRGGKGDEELDEKYNKTSSKIKDGITLAAGMAMPYGLIHLPAELTGESTNAKVFSLLGQIYDQLTQMQIMQVNDLFNGSSNSMQALWRIIDGGTFTLFDGNNTLFDYHEEIKKMFFAALIPKTWEVAPGFEDEKGSGYLKRVSTPIFLKTGSKCGEDPPWDIKDNYHLSDDVIEICYEGNQWYIVVVESWFSGSAFGPSWSHKLRTLPGTDVLVKEGGFQGVTATDMLISALSAYEQSGGKQFWSPPKGSSVVKKDGSGYALQFTDGLHTPGLVQMQVCTDWEKMRQAMLNTGDLTDKREWPCGFIEG
ncbi:hypothetical protein VTN31DRAFT_2805 [Thermomyces dupontii]|uniref:uncharacterized protein n=1 Tax=Talaromyces thermophilus TaxID=28565 RepID=UPI0037421381